MHYSSSRCHHPESEGRSGRPGRPDLRCHDERAQAHRKYILGIGSVYVDCGDWRGLEWAGFLVAGLWRGGVEGEGHGRDVMQSCLFFLSWDFPINSNIIFIGRVRSGVVVKRALGHAACSGGRDRRKYRKSHSRDNQDRARHD